MDRLNNVLRKKVNELDEAKKKNHENMSKIKNFELSERENQEVKVRYSEINKKISQYENEVAKYA